MRRRTLVKLVTYPVVLIVIVIVLVWINATFLLITT
jgi:type II secretory pathway component PulF